MSKDLFPTFRRLSRSRGPVAQRVPYPTTGAQRRALLRLTAVAAEERLPLADLLAAWAEDESGFQRSRVARLAALLKDGTPLAEAVEQVPGALRESDVLAIRFGSQSGTLAASVREALDEADELTAGRPSTLGATLAYGAIVAIVFTIIVTFLYIKIVPSFQSILDDYAMEQPEALRQSINFANVVSNYWFLFALVPLVLVWSLFSASPGRAVRRWLAMRTLGPLREVRAAEVLGQLSVAASAGRPLPGALSTLARYHFAAATRNQLLLVRNEVEQGADVWQSMSALGLISAPERRALTLADRLGNRAWTLKQLARGKQRRTSRRLERVSAMVLPVMVVLLGAFVLFQALSLFVPLIQIIINLT
jgi:type II secretory pathway component PulF